MFDFIPIDIYTPLYYYITGLIVLFTLIHCLALDMNDSKNLSYIKTTGWITFFFVIFYMGYRPIHGVFVDMTMYAHSFNMIKDGFFPFKDKDYMFFLFTLISSKFVDSNTYFFLCALVYVIPMFIISRKWFGDYWFYAFIMLVVSFSFWAYGTNGIRNGMATSIFLLGLSRDKRFFQILWILVAIAMHKSLALPAICYLFVQFYNNPKVILFFWIACIPLSLIGGGYWESILANIDFGDNRNETYLSGQLDMSHFSKTGFRWDFLLYSGVAVFAGWYYIFKLKFEDKTYNQLYNIYLLSNAFWIIAIRAAFSNRFAYLSWFMMALVIIYPLLKEEILKEQHTKIGFIIIAYYGFTFFMSLLYK